MTLPPFQQLLDAYGGDVYRFLAASAGGQEAEDLYQETLLAALRAYPRLNEGSNLRGWLLRIAYRKTIDAHRSRNRRPLPMERLPEPGGEAPAEREPTLWVAVRGLPPKQRAAVVLRYVNDLRYAQIGALVGCSEAAARRNVSEGLTRLRKEWQR